MSVTWKIFDLPVKLWWQPLLGDASAEQIQDRLADGLCKYKDTTGDPAMADILEGFLHDLNCVYVTDCCLGEGTGTTTIGETATALRATVPSREETKARNIAEALSMLKDDTTLGVQRIRELHKVIGKDVICDAGTYRVTGARLVGYSMLYLAPKLIERKLDELVAGIAAWLPVDGIDAAKRAAVFMSRFCFIHPFSNGNGRVARLCVSMLMKDWACVPVSLSGPSSRDVYLKCIHEAHIDPLRRPSSLALYILWNACTCTENACFALDL